MDKELKAKWVSALRSGDYEQGSFLLRFREADGQNTYCCLGVLLAAAGKLPDDANPITRKYSYEEHSATLPRSFRKYCRIPKSAEDTLMSMNDSDRRSFQEIADWIEANL